MKDAGYRPIPLTEEELAEVEWGDPTRIPSYLLPLAPPLERKRLTLWQLLQLGWSWFPTELPPFVGPQELREQREAEARLRQK